MTDHLDLAARHREQVEALLREHVPQAEVWAYGSRVNGMNHEASDLDLVLRGPDLAAIPTLQLADLTEAFRHSNIPILVEARDWARLPESFHDEIERNYVVVRRGLVPKDQSVSDNWPTVRLGDCIVINPLTYSPKERWSSINYLDTGNITENRIGTVQHLVVGKDKVPTRARRKVRAGDIVYSTVRPNQRHYGLLKDVPRDLLVSTGFAVIRGKKDLSDTDYVYWFLSQDHIVDHLQTIAEHSTSAYPSIKPSDIESIELVLPPMEEQRSIASVLGRLDDKIELSRRMNETLEEVARALFKSWFVDFDPVRAKMEGRWRPGESLPGLPAELYGHFPECLADSELGPIPEGWRIKDLGDIVEFRYGKALKAKDRRGGSVPVFGSNGLIGWHDEALANGPGIVVGRKGHPGTVHWAPTGFHPIDTAFYVLPKIASSTSLYFMFHVLDNADLNTLASDSAVPGLNRNLAYRSRILQPPQSIVQVFSDYVKTVRIRWHMLSEEMRNLTAQRNTLLPHLISGKLALKDLPDVC